MTVKLSLCLIKHHAIRLYGAVEIYLHIFLTTDLDGTEWKESPLPMEKRMDGP
jgi:hypothetical protein